MNEIVAQTIIWARSSGGQGLDRSRPIPVATDRAPVSTGCTRNLDQGLAGPRARHSLAIGSVGIVVVQVLDK